MARMGLVSLLLPIVGCIDPQSKLDPMQAMAKETMAEILIPAVKEGLAQGVENLQIQAGAQGINPSYKITFDGKWVVGIEGTVTVGIDGVAGQIQISTTSTEKTLTSPQQHDETIVGPFNTNG